MNGSSDAFLFDLETRSMELISKRFGSDESGMGDTWLPVPSDDARYVAFTAYSFDLTSPAPADGGLWVYLRDRSTQTTQILPADYACAYGVDMSGDATFIVVEGNTRCDGGREDGDFDSALEHRVPNGDMRHLGADAHNQQVYRYDRGADETTVVSKDASGALGDDWSDELAMSGDGRLIVFRSRATNLVPNDINGAGDILLYDASSDSLERISSDPDGTQADGDSKYPDISGDGSTVSFASKARNLLPSAPSGNYQLYVRSLEMN